MAASFQCRWSWIWNKFVSTISGSRVRPLSSGFFLSILYYRVPKLIRDNFRLWKTLYLQIYMCIYIIFCHYLLNILRHSWLYTHAWDLQWRTKEIIALQFSSLTRGGYSTHHHLNFFCLKYYVMYIKSKLLPRRFWIINNNEHTIVRVNPVSVSLFNK